MIINAVKVTFEMQYLPAKKEVRRNRTQLPAKGTKHELGG